MQKNRVIGGNLVNLGQRTWLSLAAAAVGAASISPALAQTAPSAAAPKGALVEWPVYGGSLTSQFYSPLDQINARNVKDLKVAWRWDAGNFGPNPELKSENTPLMIDGVLYATAGATRNDWVRNFQYPAPRTFTFTEIITAQAGYVAGIDSNGRTKQSREANPPAHSMSGLRLAAAQPDAADTFRFPRVPTGLKLRVSWISDPSHASLTEASIPADRTQLDLEVTEGGRTP